MGILPEGFIISKESMELLPDNIKAYLIDKAELAHYVPRQRPTKDKPSQSTTTTKQEKSEASYADTVITESSDDTETPTS